MSYDPFKHNRKSIRLRGYDYTAPGLYFVTIVTHRRMCLFGDIAGGEMRLNECGRIAADCWRTIPDHCSTAAIDDFVIMPNHVHGIVVIRDNGQPHGNVGAQQCCAPTWTRTYQTHITRVPQQNVHPGSIGAIIRAYKSAVTTRVNQSRGTPGQPIWQRNYYEHIIRNEYELSRIREYIRNNPLRWESDTTNH